MIFTTGPMMLRLGTDPYERESHDRARLSPIKKYPPLATCQVAPKWAESASRRDADK
jgi:hypothetical protein